MTRRSLAPFLSALLVLGACAPAPRAAPAPRTSAAADAVEPPPATPAPTATRPVPPGGVIGANDLLEVMVLEAPELNRTVRVASTGMISLPLLGEVRASGRTPRALELDVEAQLRRRYMRDPHVGVQVTEMQSRAVSVVGAVTKPGLFPLGEPRSLLEVIALAGGFSPQAGETVLVTRGAAHLTPAGDTAAATATEVRVVDLIESGDPRHNVLVHPGDLVTVRPAGLVYVLGEVRKPGAFPLDRRPGLTVLQAIALGEGLAPRAAKGRALLIRTDRAGARSERRVDLGDVIAGRAADPVLQAQDVVFVPNSKVKSVALGAVDALVRMVTLRGVF